MSITVEQFVERLTQSGLMSAAEIASFQQSLPPEKRPKDVQGLAQMLVRAGKLTKYQAQAVYQGKTRGLVFGEYTVLDKLGQGGMGVVLKAKHRRHGPPGGGEDDFRCRDEIGRCGAAVLSGSQGCREAGAPQHRYRPRRQRT